MTLKYNFQDTDSLYSLRKSGADLSQYHDQLARERTARTLTLRRTARPTIAGVFGKIPTSSPSRGVLFDAQNFPFLDATFATEVLESGDEQRIIEFLNNIQTVFNTTPRLLNALITSDAISQPFNDSLMNSTSEPLIIEIIKTITTIYPKCGPNQEKFIDDGLIFTYLNFLQSDNINILVATITSIDTLSEISSYARDSVLCTGILTDLIRIASSQENPQLTQLSCDAIDRIFANPEPIDSALLKDSINEISVLLNIQDLVALKSVLQTLVSITNQKPSLVFIIYEIQIAPQIVQLLNHQDLAPAALSLLGNMSVSTISNIKQLLENQLLDRLLALIQTEYASDVFWVLSNLLESVPHILVPAFDQQFLSSCIQTGQDAEFNLKREISFFVATFLIFTPNQHISFFMNEDVIDLLQSMLVCGVGLIILRVLDALMKLIELIPQVEVGKDFVEAILSEDMFDSLDSIAGSGSPLMIERANFLIELINQLASSRN